MPQITTMLTLVAMLWHAVAGCCAHHAHPPVFGWNDHTETQVAHEHADTAHACHHHHAGHVPADDSEPGHDHSDPGGCNHVDCVFSAASSDGHLALSKLIGSQLYFDSSSLVSLDDSPRTKEDCHLLRSTATWQPRPPVYIEFQSLLI